MAEAAPAAGAPSGRDELSLPSLADEAADLQLAPPNLEFVGPFTAPSKCTVTATNTSAVRICVKVSSAV